jgi:DNA topoisomerase-1
MTNALVIVESPAKAATIKKYLGKGYSVMASVGHLVDLPTSKLGVDVDNDFTPTYEISKGKKKVMTDIVKAAKGADTVFLASDPDREGEAIAWHIANAIKGKEKKTKTKKAASGPVIHRVRFNEITPKAIKAAINAPADLDTNLFEAQQARRILDRLVGYQISPLLWEKVKRGLSAGRVQSVALRIVCKREDEIKKFVAEEYWSLVAHMRGSKLPEFESKLIEWQGKKAEIKTGAQADKLLSAVKASDFILKEVVRQERRRHPTPPFITSKLQQEAARKLGFTAKKTMMLAQRLYEGVEMGEEGYVALITYMRTDSVRVSSDALTEVREFIGGQFGKNFLPESPNQYKGKKGAQDAHEAIRPVSMEYAPDKVKAFLERDMFRLYDLIWKRFVASQMVPAIFDQTTFNIAAGDALFRSTGSVLKFQGFIAVYMEGTDETGEKDEEENETLPDLTEGETLKCMKLEPHQHFTQPPPRFTEASLVKELEEQGIGRPSTYASIMGVIQEKEYVKKQEGKFHPTHLGTVVNELLTVSFPNIFDVGFTAQMESELDDIEDGTRGWVSVLNDFYTPFKTTLEQAKVEMKDVKRQEIPTEFKCEKCASAMVIKWGRHGEFLACSNYPECKNTKEFRRLDDGSLKIAEAETTDEVCVNCGSPMLIKRGRFGKFLACSKYPECKTTKAISIGVKCPECAGDIVQKQSRKGKVFFGCGNYPKCNFATWDRPVPEACPQCKSPFLVEKYSKQGGTKIKCPNKECGFEKS